MPKIKNLKFKTKNFDTGFTVIELLVAVALFSTMAMITTGIFVQTIKLERRFFSVQSIHENALTVFGLMAREIRVSTIAGPDSNCTSNVLNITVLNSSGNPVNVTYQLNSATGIVERVYGGVTYLVSSDDLIFDSLRFCILNSGVNDQSARVTILTSVSSRSGKSITPNLQTTVTSRDVSLELEN